MDITIQIMRFIDCYCKSNSLNNSFKVLKMTRNLRNLHKSDFSILYKNATTPSSVSVDVVEAGPGVAIGEFLPKNSMENLASALEKSSSLWSIPLKSCLVKGNRIEIRINRVETYKMIGKCVKDAGAEYGLVNKCNSSNEIFINASELYNSQYSTMTLDQYRSQLIAEHVSSLLEASGKSVKTNVGIREIGQPITLKTSSSEKQCYDQLKKSIYTTGCGDSDCTIDLKRYIEENNLPQGKYLYDINLGNCKVTDGCMLLKQISELNNSTTMSQQCILHVVQSNHSYVQQQTDIAWKILTKPPPQFHLVHGGVTTKDKSRCSASEYYRLRFDQVKEASIQKYGTEVNEAAVKFELLSSACQNDVKVDLSPSVDTCGPPLCREGTFILYNCARLATLFTHFKQKVERGLYPALPSIDSIDFTTLSDEDEWNLLFNYVLPFPDVVKCCIEKFDDNCLNITIHTHRICGFLQNLTRKLSSYYNRVHILVEPRPHLLPVIFARLYLMKFIQQVIHNSLSLLRIDPLQQV
ncbi:DALR anticodon-binding domain-containing protein 3-like isoform X2 [Tubulanus polymorphus]|uniref:DALR anticodon-binding domain-containing protein 3-like isoform X2 n=1 Tax=Tubulanus polymorphus TaxID=672921 RepID=UPI003DA4C186